MYSDFIAKSYQELIAFVVKNTFALIVIIIIIIIYCN